MHRVLRCIVIMLGRTLFPGIIGGPGLSEVSKYQKFWKTIKYEYLCIHPEENGRDLYSGIK